MPRSPAPARQKAAPAAGLALRGMDRFCEFVEFVACLLPQALPDFEGGRRWAHGQASIDTRAIVPFFIKDEIAA